MFCVDQHNDIKHICESDFDSDSDSDSVIHHAMQAITN